MVAYRKKELSCKLDHKPPSLHRDKKLSSFCPCPQTIWESKFKGNGLIVLLEMSRQYLMQALVKE